MLLLQAWFVQLPDTLDLWSWLCHFLQDKLGHHFYDKLILQGLYRVAQYEFVVKVVAEFFLKEMTEPGNDRGTQGGKHPPCVPLSFPVTVTDQFCVHWTGCLLTSKFVKQWNSFWQFDRSTAGRPPDGVSAAKVAETT